MNIAGLDISVENPEGSERSGVDRGGKEWKVTMKSHYGYIRGTEGADQEQVDVFVKPGTPNDYEGPVFVMNQEEPETQKFDEHKALLGFGDRDAAVEGYLENYADDWDGAGSIATFPNVEAFQDWLNRGDKRRPVGELEEEADGGTRVAMPRSIYGDPSRGRYYLKIEGVLTEKMPGRASKEQIMGILKNAGIKQDELSEVDLDRFFATPKEALISGRIEIPGNEQYTKGEVLAYLERFDPTRRFQLDELESENSNPIYKDYTLPGGWNYREWLIKYRRPEQDSFEQQHFPAHKNVMAHIRTTNRMGTNGEKILLLEEVQSDWHREGRRGGYQVQGAPHGPSPGRADEKHLA